MKDVPSAMVTTLGLAMISHAERAVMCAASPDVSHPATVSSTMTKRVD